MAVGYRTAVGIKDIAKTEKRLCSHRPPNVILIEFTVKGGGEKTMEYIALILIVIFLIIVTIKK